MEVAALNDPTPWLLMPCAATVRPAAPQPTARSSPAAAATRDGPRINRGCSSAPETAALDSDASAAAAQRQPKAAIPDA
jgi:hypothetical protein